MTTKALRLALDALGMCRIMAADSDGNYTKEVTPKVITAAITACQEALVEHRLPLTEDEIVKALDDAKIPEHNGLSMKEEIDIVRAVEAAHGITGAAA